MHIVRLQERTGEHALLVAGCCPYLACRSKNNPSYFQSVHGMHPDAHAQHTSFMCMLVTRLLLHMHAHTDVR